MVATVLRLRYRILGNNLVRNPWQLVGYVIGALWALALLAMIAAGLVALSLLQGLEVARVVATLGGALLLLGWLLGPLLIAGMDSTVDASRLAPFPLSTLQIMRALTATGLTGIPGIVTTLAALSTLVLWLRWPAAAAVGLACIAIAVLTCVVATRLMSTLSTGLGGNRRGREIVGTLVLLVIVLSGPIITGAAALLGGLSADLGPRLAQIAAVVGWTPLGAAWAVPGDIAAGGWLAALAKLAIAAATLVVLWLLWARASEAALTSPPRRAVASVRPGSLGWFGRMPTGAVGATWARSLTGWLRDPRYLRQLLVVPLFPVVFAFASGVDGPMFTASAFAVAFVLSIAGYTDISYDGTAFAGVLATGIRGRDDRVGRLLGAACIGVPLAAAVAVATVAIAGRWDQLPAVLGGAFGILLAGYGVDAVSSALIVSPVPGPGDSPFKSAPGQTFVNSMLVFVVLAAVLVVATPAAVLAVISLIAGDAGFGWAALAAGLVVGAAATAAGVVVGGRFLDRTGPDLLARMKAFPR